MNRRRTAARWAGVALVGGLAGVVGSTAANAAFTDVPPENQFAEHITSVQEAGIATGFPDGSFHPTEDLNRQQAAAWVDRAASRVGLDIYGGDHPSAIVLDSDNPSAVVAQVEIASPAAGDGEGWVSIQGGVGGVGYPGASCPCTVYATILREDDVVVGRSSVTMVSDPTGQNVSISPLLAVTPIGAGETHTYRVLVQLADPTQSVHAAAAMYATYSPIAIGEPTQQESGSTDPVESLIPS